MVTGLSGCTVCAAYNATADRKRGRVGRGECTARVGMNRGLVVGVVVYTLDNIDLASGRPVGSIGPDWGALAGCLV